jgi:hypothetical protein
MTIDDSSGIKEPKFCPQLCKYAKALILGVGVTQNKSMLYIDLKYDKYKQIINGLVYQRYAKIG